ncbi:MAG TPA: alkaline phosphatase family protein [Mycobacteriales bacterium]|nr:alkaline phosphatase family protein [Mycobacteriales bacterium]
MRRVTLLLSLLGLLSPLAPAVEAVSGTPHIGHVWTILFENEEFEQTFLLGRTAAPYLTQTLTDQGELLVQYYGTGHSSLDNYLAMTSGQGPNPSTKDDCDDPTTLGGAHHKWHFGAYGQAIDDSGAGSSKAGEIGCTYPAKVKNLADQLDAAHVSWKGYMENMDAQPGKPAHCASPLNTGPDIPKRQIERPDYKDKHNPFGYFHSIVDRRADCNRHVVPMGYFSHHKVVGPLARDLRSVATTPRYSYITPGLCHDGHDACPSNNGNQLKGIDQFLSVVVPQIMRSPAYRKDGLIVVTFDEGTTNLKCCGEVKAPNLSATQNNGYPIPGPVGDGGGMTGALLLSPYVDAGSIDLTHAFNHYSYLRSMEDLFGIRHGGADGHGHLGYAALPGLQTFQQAGVIPS